MGLASASHLENDVGPKTRTLNRRRGVASLGALAFYVLMPIRGASAQELTFRLSWQRGAGAEDCPNAQQLTSAVESRLGRSAFAEPAFRHIDGGVEHVASVWRARLRVLGADDAVLGSRELEAYGPDCSSIAEAVSLAIALTIDPNALHDHHDDSMRAAPAMSPASPSPPVTPPPEPPPAVPAKPAPSRNAEKLLPAAGLAGAVVPRTLLALGALPKASFGAELGAEVDLGRRLGLALGMAYLAEARTAGGEFGLSIAAGSLGLCFHALERPRAELKLCGELMAGAVQVVVYNPIPTHPGEHLWLAPRLGPRFAYALGASLSLELAAAAVVPLVREQFAIAGVKDPLFQTSRVSLLSSLGLRVSIP
jgi:hypothetical protein